MTPLSSRLPASSAPVLRWTLFSLLLLMAWDASGLDLFMAQWFGTASGFALTNHWLWRGLLHDDILWLPWLVELTLLAAMVWPFGTLRRLETLRRVQLALTTLAALLLISTFKHYSHTSCPWDLQQFGGVASHVSHWSWGLRDGGTGGCFPAGHASAGFAFLGGYFAFRHAVPATARRWLAGALVCGLVLGLAQQVRGAHYMSHTLWTGWLCWTCAALMDRVVTQWLAQTPSSSQIQMPALS